MTSAFHREPPASPHSHTKAPSTNPSPGHCPVGYQTNISLIAMSLGTVPLSTSRHSPPSQLDPTIRSTRHNGNSSSPSDPFANLDPALHPTTLNNADPERDLSPQAENRLNDFAQHVLGSHDDATNLLAFTNGDDGGLFGTNHSQQYTGLMEAAVNERVDGDETQDEYLPEGGGDSGQDGVGETPNVRTRGGGRKRRREGGEEGENGGLTDPIKVKKDSHVSVQLHGRGNIDSFRRKRSSEDDERTSTTGLARSPVLFLGDSRRWERGLCYVERLSTSQSWPRRSRALTWNSQNARQRRQRYG